MKIEMDILKNEFEWKYWNKYLTGNNDMKLEEKEFQNCRHIEDFEDPKKKTKNVNKKIVDILKKMS